jgi:hypothetical protein
VTPPQPRTWPAPCGPQWTATKGKAAIANARLAYQAYEEVIASQRWQKLAGLGAQPQRPLWASTGIKNHAYPDTMYVTELVAADNGPAGGSARRRPCGGHRSRMARICWICRLAACSVPSASLASRDAATRSSRSQPRYRPGHDRGHIS